MNQKTIPAKPDRAAAPTRPAAITPLPQPAETPPEMWAYWPQSPTLPQPPSIRRRLTYLTLGWAIALLLALIVALFTAGVLFYRSNVIVPGVYVAGVSIGGHSMPDAAALLRAQSQERGIVLEADSSQQALIPEALGISLDTAATVSLAHRQGRSLESLRRLIDNRGQIELEPVWKFDPLPALQTLQALAPQFELKPVDADIRLVDGQVEAAPAVMGQSLDIEATMANLSQDPLHVLAEGRLPLILKTVTADLTDVSRPVDEANEFLDHTITVQAYDPIDEETISLKIEPDVWNPWISVWLNETDPTEFEWSLDADQAQKSLTQQIETIGPEQYLKPDETVEAVTTAITNQSWSAADLRVFHHDQPHTVQFGETLSSIGFDYGIPYPWIEQANPGVNNSLSPGQEIIIPSPDALLPLPVVKNKRIVVSLSEQKLWAYEQGQLKWEWPISTGISSSPTAPGVFQVQSHETNAYAASWNLWMPDFIGIYRPVPTADFMNGFHGFPSRNGATLLWTNDLGHPVTYGCILVDSKHSGNLFEWAEAGVVVEIEK
ncbi:MAG: L,D-transpeptidase family protein [Anaerolineae bacterium]|nr:L,D-transpeptidase family protein [Anaerolineae bacterium]MCB9102773.1 L,D-transpeptidase family protein [Anaerolineales bacterium]